MKFDLFLEKRCLARDQNLLQAEILCSVRVVLKLVTASFHSIHEYIYRHAMICQPDLTHGSLSEMYCNLSQIIKRTGCKHCRFTHESDELKINKFA